MSEFTETVNEEVVEKMSDLDVSDQPPPTEEGIAQETAEGDEFVDCIEGTDFVYEKSIEKAIQAKEEGNNYFRNKEYDDALESYSKAITYCPEEDKENLATFYGNRSAAYASLEEWELVVEDCSAAIEIKPDYVKVIARRMLANEKLEKYEEALAGEQYAIIIYTYLYLVLSKPLVLRMLMLQ